MKMIDSGLAVQTICIISKTIKGQIVQPLRNDIISQRLAEIDVTIIISVFVLSV